MQTAPNTLPWPTRPTPPLNRANVALGLTISLLLHFLLAAWSWQHRVASHRFPETTSIAVHLVPAPPALPTPVPSHPELMAQQRQAQHRPTQTAKSQVLATAPAQVASDVPAPPVAAEPAPQQQKHLDMNAVYGSVKSAVAEIDRENAQTPTGQLAAKPLYRPEPDNKMGKMIDGTTRADCKDQVEGHGLLTPIAVLATLLDKKDSGCKWR